MTQVAPLPARGEHGWGEGEMGCRALVLLRPDHHPRDATPPQREVRDQCRRRDVHRRLHGLGRDRRRPARARLSGPRSPRFALRQRAPARICSKRLIARLADRLSHPIWGRDLARQTPLNGSRSGCAGRFSKWSQVLAVDQYGLFDGSTHRPVLHAVDVERRVEAALVNLLISVVPYRLRGPGEVLVSLSAPAQGAPVRIFRHRPGVDPPLRRE